MEIVMPRWRSSGALSIWSKGVKLVLALLSDSTFVMAAVRVVLPWSMCPIVPTFTWGFERSNFFLAISWHYSLISGRRPLGPATAVSRPSLVFGGRWCWCGRRVLRRRRLLAACPGDDLLGDGL